MRISFKAALLTVSGLTLAACAATPADPLLAANGETQVCRTQKVIGSNLLKKHCMSAASWDELDEQQRLETQEFNNRVDDQSNRNTGASGGLGG